MKKKNTPSLLGYSALAATFVAVGSEAEGQVIYTDIDPDVTIDLNGDFFELDLNGDATPDFRLTKRFLSSFNPTIYTTYGNVYSGTIQLNHIYGTALGSNAILGDITTFGFQYPFALDSLAWLCEDGEWMEGGYQSLVYSYGYKLNLGSSVVSYVQLNGDGFWFGGQTDKYLGLQLRQDGEHYFGWLRLDVAPDNIAFTVKEYAISAVPDSCIQTGHPAPDAITGVWPTGWNAYTWNNRLVIHIGNDVTGAPFRLVDLTGREVLSGRIDQPLLQIDTDLPAGIYNIMIQFNDLILQRKLYLSAAF